MTEFPLSSPAQVGRPVDAYPDKIDGAVLKIAGVVVLGAIMSILDITVVNVALPELQTTFTGTDNPLSYATVAWTVTAYTLALATVIPLTGWAADRFGTKRLYMLAIALFTLGSVLCAAATSINLLILFRVLQGLGGGLLMPLGMTIMTRAAGPHRMGRLMAILGIPMLLGPILGPILGGYLIDAVSWHWIFLINLPLGIIALLYAAWALPKDTPEPSESFDFLGMAMMSPGLAMFLYGISSIPEAGTFFSAKVMGWGTAGLLLLIAFVIYSFKPKHPLLDFRLFQNRNLTVATITMFIFGAAFFGGLLLVPTYFQQVRGEDALHAGLLVAPQGIGAMVTMPIAGALADKKPVGRIVPFGLLAIIVGMFLLSRVDGDTSYWGYIIPVLFLLGLGMGGTMMPIMTSAIKTLTAHQVARGSTLLNITQQIASSVGVAIMSVVLTNGLKNDALVSQAAGFREASAGVTDPAQIQQLLPQFPKVAEILAAAGNDQAAGAAKLAAAAADAAGKVFGNSFLVAAFLVLLTLVPAFFLPRDHEESHLTDDEDDAPAAPVFVH
ncbi:DHA2 family efflux MFS transporter permease subunit [Nostocoides australiense]|uniref:Multidrug resistance protein B homolog n=1 Tax=Nostocoides australiense Ben110 TaxID=1193182 RepID=W6JUF8_9MICO|nr:DHA2 family efflux MFS transporter permease subunit [Tetrasphaera australiensis]CCH73018.1 Multidrug resistance protein B homolog [Tetrasphaera australiensis Ben110]HPF81415.1 DHA2 family efflux MFS transporter permease subunit [Tetrasphaera australiensis]HRW01806.1 DHA2 family efflux MFS transporter permease subunit [Tetrasphaera sp.]